MDFIFMLTRNDRTVDDADELIESILSYGVRHIGFKDVGVQRATMQGLVRKIAAAGATSYLEVVSTTPDSVVRSLEAGRAIGVDRILGGTDLEAAKRVLGNLSGYFPFPGRPVGHPTRLEGSAALIADHCSGARNMGCGGVDLLAYRAIDSDPLELVRAARTAMKGGRLIVAGSVNSRQRIHALAAAGADAFTIGTAAFDGSFSPSKGSLRGQILDILEACATAPKMAVA
jgi:thiamine monophosphate synthase